jgi:hypothetical protein
MLQTIWFGDLNLVGFLIMPDLYEFDYQHDNITCRLI